MYIDNKNIKNAMNTKTTLPISEARKRIFEIAKEVQKLSNHYTLTENGRAKAVIMSADEFDSLMENLEILSDPQTMADIKKAEEEYKKGDFITWEQMKKELHYKNKNSLQPSSVAEKPKKLYSAKTKKLRK